jgi:hypothetical protein
VRESLFWEAVELSRSVGRRRQAASLYRILVGVPEQVIVSFAKIQHRKMHQLYTPDILAAHFIINGYTSDDSFEDFTAWIVAQGKTAFDRARKSASSLTELLEKKDVSRMEWDAFTLLAGKAYGDKTGKEDFYTRLGAPAPPEIKIAWPADRQGFESRYPELYRKFWDQKRMKTIHS